MRKLILILLLTLIYGFWAGQARASNVTISNVSLTNVNQTNSTVDVKFDLTQDNTFSGTDDNGQSFYDRIWVFVKFWRTSPAWPTDGSSAWKHATLISGGTATPVSGGKGAFCQVGANQTLRWSFGTDNIQGTQTVKVKVMAVEMVYIPQGAFFAGDTTSASYFRQGGGTAPFKISSEAAIVVGNDSSSKLYYQTGGNYGDGGTPIPANFPKGYNAFYIMKYEISQGQYRDFLNTLTSTQADSRYKGSATISDRYGIKRSGTPAVYGCDLNDNGTFNESADGENVACNYLSWADLCYYADWAGLRPMTELEFEKACRGGSPTDNTFDGEFAWGTGSATSYSSLYHSGQVDEGPSIDSGVTVNIASNLNYQDCAPDGPIRCGAFSGASTSRIQAGASYYGVMELSGNLWERPVTVGSSFGRSFTGTNGDGDISNGVPTGWPAVSGTDEAKGAGHRGGNWYYDTSYSRVSDRSNAALVYADRAVDGGARCVRTP